jgi:hypothetical protein
VITIHDYDTPSDKTGVKVITKSSRHTAGRKTYYIVECLMCGRQKEMRSDYVKQAKSCGCLLGKHSAGKPSGRRLSEGVAAFNHLWGVYKWSASKRGLTFLLTKEEFRHLTSLPCYYCGTEPVKEFKSNNGYSTYIYNGIDRVNNNMGYEISNVVPCCTTCNKAKATMTQEEFINWIDRLVAFRSLAEKGL